MKKYAYLILIVLVSFLPLYSLFYTTDLLHTHDGLVHLPRIAAFYKALSVGHFPVRWASDLNYGYGMPLFNFIYPLPYFVASIFLHFGAGLVSAFKLSLALSYLLSGVFMYLFAKELFQNPKKAFLVSIFYQFATFRFVELLTRGSFGEVYTYTFLPLVLYAVFSLKKKLTSFNFALSALSTSLLILSHNSISLVFFGCIVFFAFMMREKPRSFMYVLAALGIGVALASFYWFPAIVEHKYTYGDLFMKDLYKNHFPQIQNFFIPNILNQKALQIESISTQFGLFQILAIILSIWVLLKHKQYKYRKVLIFSFLLILGSLVLMQPVSGILWEKISFLRQFQFPWRLLSAVVLATSLLSVSFFEIKLLSKQIIVLVIALGVVVLSIVYWQPTLGFDSINENKYWNFPLNTTYYGETDLVWSEGPAKNYAKAQIELIAGKAKVTDIKREYIRHNFRVEAKNDVSFIDNTQYYPGWKVKVDNKQVPIQFQDPNHRGLIVFSVPSGVHAVSVVFEETKTRMVANLISLVSFIVVLLLFAIGARNKVEGV